MKGKRRRAREMAIQMLYQQELGSTSLSQIFDRFDLTSYLEETDGPQNVTQGVATPGALPAGAQPVVTRTAPTQTAPTRTASARTPRSAIGQVDPAEVAAQEADKGPPLSTAAQRARAERAFGYARQLVEGTLEHRPTIDEVIRRHAENWRLERMPVIDRNILRLAVYEMRFESGVPKVVIVDEAIELAKKFGAENSGRFINGLLDGILQATETEAPEAEAVVGGSTS